MIVDRGLTVAVFEDVESFFFFFFFLILICETKNQRIFSSLSIKALYLLGLLILVYSNADHVDQLTRKKTR